MLKKSLLASIALISIAPIQAEASSSSPRPSNCPPCPCGGVNGWVLIPAGPGMPCNQGANREEGVQSEPAVETPQPHHHTKRSMHPPRTPEQEQLEIDLKDVKPHIYLRVNPNDPKLRKEGEWGKELDGKVYFRHLGNWEHDPSVKATDIANQGQVKEKVGFFEKLLKPQPQPQQRQQPRPRARVVETQEQPAVAVQQTPTETATAENQAGNSTETGAASPPPPPPPPPVLNTPTRKLGKAPVKKHPTVKTTQPVLTVPHATSGQGVRGPATQNPDLPGAPGTPQATLPRVNAQPDNGGGDE